MPLEGCHGLDLNDRSLDSQQPWCLCVIIEPLGHFDQCFLERGKRIDPKCPRDRSGGKTDVNVDVDLSEILGERADDP